MLKQSLTYVWANVLQCETEILQLKKELQEKQNVIDEKDEELIELNEIVTKKVCSSAAV